ncbi:MAG: cell division protein FtsZ [Candidatus Micrarchaeota archaeon]|nr:cell division protein FtsZ [Candidatus Micrarchaeota archaeon]MDE1847692.1 cell division protein FtsZ [Candidatus Micrarchaeota archaeon]MDE1864121.1 cell division protein FtsZ [Candidatus Micrarchaeota archaeon]
MPEAPVTTQLSPDDEELLKFIENARPKIYVVGAGGSGSNTISRMAEMNIDGTTLVAANTDASHLAKTKSTRKILIGKKSTRGLGAGSEPKVGEDAAIESREELRHVLSDAQLVFITCGLGGGTGTGSAPVIAHEAKEMGALTIGIVTLPFSSEGRVRMRNALEGLARLKRVTDTTIIIPNDKLLAVAPDLPLNMAFRVSDEVLANATKGILEMVTKPGMVNLDFADLRSVLKDSGYALVGIGEANSTQTTNRAQIAIENTLKSPLLDVDLSTAKKALVNIIGGEDLTLREAESIFQEVASRISDEGLLKWGARIDPTMQKSSVKVMVVLGGVEFADYTETGIKNKIQESEDIDLDEIFGEGEKPERR